MKTLITLLRNLNIFSIDAANEKVLNKLKTRVQTSQEFYFHGYEEHDYNSFKANHVCPNRKLHDHVLYKVTLSSSSTSAIGNNTYVKCERCGCMQDITDYTEW